MYFVAMVFAELGSHYPISGALYQYAKNSVSAKYGWWVGWFYSVALLVTVAAVDTGVVPYLTTLLNSWFKTNLDPTNHTTILYLTLALLAIQTILNVTGAKVMGRVASFGSYVEIFGTIGIALILAAAGFNHGFGFLFSTQGAENAATIHSVLISVVTGGWALRLLLLWHTHTSSMALNQQAMLQKKLKMQLDRCHGQCAKHFLQVQLLPLS